MYYQEQVYMEKIKLPKSRRLLCVNCFYQFKEKLTPTIFPLFLYAYTDCWYFHCCNVHSPRFQSWKLLNWEVFITSSTDNDLLLKNPSFIFKRKNMFLSNPRIFSIISPTLARCVFSSSIQSLLSKSLYLALSSGLPNLFNKVIPLNQHSFTCYSIRIMHVKL